MLVIVDHNDDITDGNGKEDDNDDDSDDNDHDVVNTDDDDEANLWKLFRCSRLVSHWANPLTTTSLIPVDEDYDDDDDKDDDKDDDEDDDDVIIDVDDIKWATREKLYAFQLNLKSKTSRNAKHWAQSDTRVRERQERSKNL